MRHRHITSARRPVIVNQRRHILYLDTGNEALFGTAITSFTRLENAFVASWDNSNGDGTGNYTRSITSGTTVTSSHEVAASLNLAPSFEGMSVFSVSIGSKTFRSTETTNTATRSIQISVPAGARVFLYQHRYHFRTAVYFTLDAWGDTWRAGSNGGYRVQWAIVDSYIDTEEYVTTRSQLTSTAQHEFRSQRQGPWFGRLIRQFGNLTDRAQTTLRRIGINGSQ